MQPGLPLRSYRLRSELGLAIGIALLSAAALLWLAPGRIDSIDGQYRYEVAKNLLLHGSPDLRDPALTRGAIQRSSYALGASLAGMPGVWLGLTLGSELLAQFFYSFATPLFGAALTGLMVLVYRSLGLSAKSSAAWALVATFGSQILPTTLTIFDQVQEAALLIGAALLLMRARGGWGFALSGLLAGLFVVWQTAYVVLLPALALAVAPWGELRQRAAWRPMFTFCIGLAVGPCLAALYNQYRFGDVAQISVSGGTPRFADPFTGLAVLLVSPGKSVLLYSPVVILALLGVRRFWRAAPLLARFVAACVLSQLLLIASLLFSGGDWCWGPRYLSVTLPLLLLAAPFGADYLRKSIRTLVLGASFGIQLLGISLDHHRFFFERNLGPHFWTDRSFYFTDSALLARPFEIAFSFGRTFPVDAPLFPGPYPRLPTFATYGPPPWLVPEANIWQERYPGLYWPRPWPIWSRLYGTFEQVPALAWTERGLLLMGLVGAALSVRALRRAQPQA